MKTLLEIAKEYKEVGFDVIPVDPITKSPGVTGWTTHVYTIGEFKEKLSKGWGISFRNHEIIDFDNHGTPDAESMLALWKQLIDEKYPGLTSTLLIEKTQHGGFHVSWKCSVSDENQKLARRPATPEELEKDSKCTGVVLIETRGKGGQFLVSPTKGYSVIQGDWFNLPVITPEQRQYMLNIAKTFDRLPKTFYTPKSIKPSIDGTRPGDTFSNTDGITEALDLLKQAGWQTEYSRGDSLYLRRPGKTQGISATYNAVAPGIFYCFTSSGLPFEPDKAYTPFQVFALLKHNGDFETAAKELAKRYLPPTQKIASGQAKIPERSKIVVTSLPAIDELATTEDTTIRYATGFTLIDEHIDGGLRPSNSYVLGGMEKVGKSSLMFAFVNNFIHQGIKCGYLNTELSDGEFFEKISKGEGMKASEWKLKNKQDFIYAGVDKLSHEKKINFEKILATAEFMASQGVKIVVFDNLTTLSNNLDSKRASWEVLGSAVSEVINFSKLSKTCVILVLHSKQDASWVENPENVRRIIKNNEPAKIFEESHTVIRKPQLSELLGGTSAKSQLSGAILLWRPFMNVVKNDLYKYSAVLLQSFRHNSKPKTIRVNFDAEIELYSQAYYQSFEMKED